MEDGINVYYNTKSGKYYITIHCDDGSIFRSGEFSCQRTLKFYYPFIETYYVQCE